MLLLCVKMLASISLKVHRENAKLLTPNLQNARLYSHGGVDDFRCPKCWGGNQEKRIYSKDIIDFDWLIEFSNMDIVLLFYHRSRIEITNINHDWTRLLHLSQIMRHT